MNIMNTEIILQRHGESLGNAVHAFLGHTDLDLSELGYRQANVAAEFLRNEHIDYIYSSDLKRAFNTAVPHARIRGMKVIADKRLREIYAGDWEGQLVTDLVERYPREFCVQWRYNFGSFDGAPNGESVAELAARIEGAVISIAKTHPDSRILIATHAAAIRSMWGKISDYTPEEVSKKLDFPANASITRVIFDGKCLIPVSYSEDKHLGSMTTYWNG